MNIPEGNDIYAQKEVPVVEIITYDRNLKELNRCVLNSLYNYYESFDTKDHFRTEIEATLLSPEIYQILTNSANYYFSLNIYSVWRSSKTLEDEIFKEECPRFYNHIHIHYDLNVEGEPTSWYIELTNE